MPDPIPSNEEKSAVWRAYYEGKPIRVPMRLNTNPRIILLDPKLNRDGIAFAEAQEDPETHVKVALQHQHYLRTTLHRYCDWPVGLPEVWEIGLNVQNVYEAACLGGEVVYPPNQVPTVEPFATGDDREAVFDADIDRPLDHGFAKKYLDFWHEMKRVCDGMTYEGRPVKLQPWALVGSDGPLTVAMNVRGAEAMMDMIEDPDYFQRLLGFCTEAAIKRRQAFFEYWGEQIGRGNGLADDSCAMVGADTYREQIMPHHERYYDAGPPEAVRTMHLCGAASHLFPMIHEQMQVMAFDTGFPIDHGKVRQQLGEDVEISGGTQVALLLEGAPDAVYDRTKQILLSGVKRGGRFILEEGNNLPPQVPEANLEAMYQACLDHGGHEGAAA